MLIQETVVNLYNWASKLFGPKTMREPVVVYNCPSKSPLRFLDVGLGMPGQCYVANAVANKHTHRCLRLEVRHIILFYLPTELLAFFGLIVLFVQFAVFESSLIGIHVYDCIFDEAPQSTPGS